FEVGGHMEQVFQALIDRSRAPLDLKTIKTIVGCKHRPKIHRRTKRSAEWEVAVERPTYDLTIFKLHCGKLTLKIYTKGERVLRIEAVAHNTRELNCGRSLDKFPEVVSRLKAVLEKFADALSCIDQCFIDDEMLEQLPIASRVGKTIVGGIDLNKGAHAPRHRSADRFVRLTQRLHRLRGGGSGLRPHRAKPITVRSSPNAGSRHFPGPAWSCIRAAPRLPVSAFAVAPFHRSGGKATGLP